MGCFDYNCECGGETCPHVGGQLDNATVIIEVPLLDGTTIYLEGEYHQYGYVEVDNFYSFYLEEFEEFFEDWDAMNDDRAYLATKVWTKSETTETEDKYGSIITGHVERSCFDKNIEVHTKLPKGFRSKLFRCVTSTMGCQ